MEIVDEAREIFGDRLDKAERYADLLRTWGIERGLIGPKEGERIWQRHILNCAAVIPYIPPGSHVADIGSGAGLPGIVIALARPDLHITLVETMLRRTRFLHEIIQELDLDDQVSVIRSRAEECSQHFDVVTARAVASLDKLLRWTHHLFLPEGSMIVLKGISAPDEVDLASSLLKKYRLVADLHPVGCEENPTSFIVEIAESREKSHQ